MTSDITLATYLFNRIKQLGVEHILGVPGDFNLMLLDYIYEVPPLKWVGFCNELNAAYAADGYGRFKQTPGVLITTYGVGELSALNGISGARAESVPLLHIVGTTGRAIQEEHLLIHHVPPADGLEEPDHTLYMQTSKPLACAHEFLYDPKKALDQIDHVITQISKQSKPGYLYIPVDMVHKKVSSDRLNTPLDLKIVNNGQEELEDKVVQQVLEAIYSSRDPIIIADTLAERHHAVDLVKQLVDKSKFLSFNTSMGKGIVDENHPSYVGVYNGKASAKGIAETVEGSDLRIHIGPLFSDSNTGGFTHETKPETSIQLHPLYCSVKGHQYDHLHFYPILEKVVKQLDTSKIPNNATPKPPRAPIEQEENAGSPDGITQTYFTEFMNNFMRPNDSLLVESGTFQFACQDIYMKENSSFVTQIFYSSIGFTFPALVGSCVARREQNHPGRCILIEGDGSAQMTIQELGTMIRYKLNPTIFLLNNDGYSIERAIWGPKQGYNDICPNWKWTQLCESLGGTPGKDCASFKVSTKKELDDLLTSKEFESHSDKVRLVEVVLDAFDYPWRLRSQVQRMGKFNRDKFEAYAKKAGEA